MRLYRLTQTSTSPMSCLMITRLWPIVDNSRETRITNHQVIDRTIEIWRLSMAQRWVLSQKRQTNIVASHRQMIVLPRLCRRQWWSVGLPHPTWRKPVRHWIATTNRNRNWSNRAAVTTDGESSEWMPNCGLFIENSLVHIKWHSCCVCQSIWLIRSIMLEL